MANEPMPAAPRFRLVAAVLIVERVDAPHATRPGIASTRRLPPPIRELVESEPPPPAQGRAA